MRRMTNWMGINKFIRLMRSHKVSTKTMHNLISSRLKSSKRHIHSLYAYQHESTPSMHSSTMFKHKLVNDE